MDAVSPWMCPTPGRGGSFCDDPVVFDRYTLHHDSGICSPNHVMEEPAVSAEIGDPTGLRVLDLGCGDASLGRTLLGQVPPVTSASMVRRA